MQLGEHPHLSAQKFGDDGHGKVIDRPMLVSFEAVQVRQMHSRNENDRRFLKTRMLADDFGKFKAVYLGHADIHQDDRNFDFAVISRALLWQICLDQVLAQIGQDGFIAQQLSRLIVHHQDVHRVSDRDHFCALAPRHVCSLAARNNAIDAATCAEPTVIARC